MEFRDEWYSCNWVEYDPIRQRLDLSFGILLTKWMLDERIDVWLFFCIGWYVTRWVMGPSWWADRRHPQCSYITITFRGLPEGQNKSQYVAYTSAIMHRFEINSRNDHDYRWQWILARVGSLPHIYRHRRWIAAGSRLKQEMEGGNMHIVTRYGLMTGGGLLEIGFRKWILGDWWQSISSLVKWYQGYAKSYPSKDQLLWFQSNTIVIECRYTDIQWTNNLVPPSMMPSHIQSAAQITCQTQFQYAQYNSYMPEWQCGIQSQGKSQVRELCFQYCALCTCIR